MTTGGNRGPRDSAVESRGKARSAGGYRFSSVPIFLGRSLAHTMRSRMMLQNERELQHSYAVLAKLYRARDRLASEPLWTPAGRTDAAAGVEGHTRSIQREIADYPTQRQGRAACQ